MDSSVLKNCIPPLIAWYREARRMLPWREEPTAYAVWISEIMLQQTRIEAVIPYYRRFLAELPDVASLAAVPEERLLKLWEGLGYYSRARNLKKAAEQLVAAHQGALPRSAEALRRLPGIGDYTAGAIASIAYGLPEPAVDGNVLRVVMRLCACSDDVLSAKTRAAVTAALREAYPSGEEAALLTEGLMELGETVCIPNGMPDCAACPLKDFCLAHRAGRETDYPVRPAKKPRRVEPRTVLLLRCGERWAVRRREGKGLLAGMWELPNLDGALDEAAVTAYLIALGTKPERVAPCGEALHLFTHVEWHMRGFLADCGAPCEDFVWKTAEEIRSDCAIPSAFRKYNNIVFGL